MAYSGVIMLKDIKKSMNANGGIQNKIVGTYKQAFGAQV